MARPNDSDLDREISDSIARNFTLHPNDFTRYLDEVADHPATSAALCRMLTCTPALPPDELLKAATSLNYVVKVNFRKRDVNPEIWEVYSEALACDDKLSWKTAKVLEDSFRQIVESFGAQFPELIEKVYPRLTFTHKVLLQNIVLYGDITLTNRVHFISLYLRTYINEGKELILWTLAQEKEQGRTEQMQGRLLEYLITIRETLEKLTHMSSSSPEAERVFKKVSQDDEAMELAEICLFLQKQRGKYFTTTGSSLQKKTENDVKSVALQIIGMMISAYSSKCSLEDFDHYRVLGFLENQLPLMVQELKTKSSEELNLECNEKLSISILQFIKTSTHFLFLTSYFWPNYREIFWKIVYPLLEAGSEERRLFTDDPPSFIHLAECIAEGGTEDEETELVQNNKVHASVLLEQIVEYIDGAMTNICRDILATMEHCLGNKTDISIEIVEQFGIKPKLECCLTMLMVLSNRIRKRYDIIQLLRKAIAQNTPELLVLRGMDEARMLLAATYCFDIFFEREVPPREYFEWVAGCINGGQVAVDCALIFFENCLSEQLKETEFKELSHSYLVWEKIIASIETTKHYKVLSLIAKTVSFKFAQLPFPQIMDIARQTLRRLAEERRCRDESKSTIWIDKGLIIIRTIAKRLPIVKERSSEEYSELCGVIWGTFDLMEDLGEASYRDELISIFNYVVASTDDSLFSQDFYQFLKPFGEYHLRTASLGKLTRTYYLLLSKSKSVDNIEDSLALIFHNILLVMKRARSTEAIDAILMMQYLLKEYPDIVDHKLLEEDSRELFMNVRDDEKYEDDRREKVAALLNLWMLGSVVSPIYSLAEFGDTHLDIFYGQHSKILAHALSLKIQQLCKSGDSCKQGSLAQIQFLLMRGVQLLKMMYSDERRSNATSKISKMASINPSEAIKQALHCVMHHLPKPEFDTIMEQVQRQVPFNQIISLLNRVQVKNEQRVIFKIK